MVERAVLLKEIDSLPPIYYGEVIDFVGYIKEKKIKENNKIMEKAAEMATEEYRLKLLLRYKKQLKKWSASDTSRI